MLNSLWVKTSSMATSLPSTNQPPYQLEDLRRDPNLTPPHVHDFRITEDLPSGDRGKEGI